MKNIIKSLAVVIAVGSFAGVATHSFFSDTETSSGNTFSAGKIDLKVDSTAHYDGLVCVDKKWKDESKCTETGNNLISNGSFENPTVSNSELWNVSADGTPDLDWHVAWESTDTTYQDRTRPTTALLELHHGVLGAAAEGDQSAELDSDWFGPSDPLNGEPASVNIFQNITTEVGKKYRLTYAFSPRPNTDASENKLSVRINGIEKDLVSSAGGGSIAWTDHQYDFIATGTTTKIEFADTGTPDSLGTLLDNVRLYKLNCTESSTSELIDTDCHETWGPTDIGAEKFFNFNDIKPGDFGEDTVSLHVYDNDAWGRLVIDQIVDKDNTCVGPELIAEPNCAPNHEGDLRKNLKFDIWLDEGQTPGFQGKSDPGEGDNIRNFDEPLLVKAGPIDAAGETQNIWEGIAAAYATHHCTVPSGHTNYGLCKGLSQDGHMLASTDYFFGIGWELPGDVGNEVQTDIFSADMSFEVVQYRNNPSHQF